MLNVSIFGESVEGRELKVYSDDVLKIHADPDDFEIDSRWEVILSTVQ